MVIDKVYGPSKNDYMKYKFCFSFEFYKIVFLTARKVIDVYFFQETSTGDKIDQKTSFHG